MKYVLSLCSLLIFLSTIKTSQCQPTILFKNNGQSIQLVSTEDFVVELVQKISDPECVQETTPTRAKKQTVASIFSGLAQSCTHLGQIVTAQNEEDKKQGMINLLGTVFSVAAEVSGPSSNSQNTSNKPTIIIQEHNDQLTTKIIELTQAVFRVLDLSVYRSSQPLEPLLSFVKAQRNEADRRMAIQTLMAATSKSQEFLQELFSTAYASLKDGSADIAEHFKQILSDYITVNNLSDKKHVIAPVTQKCVMSTTKALSYQPTSINELAQTCLDALCTYCLKELSFQAKSPATPDMVLQAIKERTQTACLK